jgi:prepilin-type N-terminal cleavage/methylation domain-containing protein
MGNRADNPGLREHQGGIAKARGLDDGSWAIPGSNRGFTLLEVLTALAILALASSSVMIVIDRCVASASDSTLRMEAFELVRENLEKILILDAVEENADYGTSDKYPSISWQTVIEGFSEPLSSQMWLRAVCSADYVDSKGEKQKVELVHWLTQLTDQQAGQLVDQKDLEKLEMEQVMKTDEEAAAYAKIDTDTLRKWVEDGLVKTQEDAFLRCNLDVFIRSQGNPTPEEKAQQVESVQDLALRLRAQQKELEENGALGMPPGTDGQKGTLPPSKPGLQKMDPGQVMDLVRRGRE